MATDYFVSNTISNGYSMGDDSNPGTSKTAPFLTYGKAVDSYSAGDIININDGSYLTTDGGDGATFITLTKAVTILPYSALGVTITSTNATYNHLVTPSAPGTYTLGGLVLDNNNVGFIGLQLSNTAHSPTLILNNTKFANHTLRAISVSETDFTSIEFNDISIYAPQLLLTGAICIINAIASGDITINGLTLDITTAGAGGGTMDGIKLISTSGTNSTVVIQGVNGTITGNGSNQINPGIISIENIPGVEISDFDLTLTDMIGTYGIWIISGAGGAIHNGTLNYNCVGGFGIYSTAPDTDIYDCIVTNDNTNQGATPHGISFHDTTGGNAYHNDVSGFSPAYYASLTDATTIFHYNIAHQNYGNYVLYGKGATGSKFYNNTVFSSLGFAGISMGLQTNGATHSTNVEFKNNVFYNSASSPKFLLTDANQTGIFTNNLYYAIESLPSIAWQYGGVNYNTFAGWQGVEASAIWGDPLFAGAINNNFNIKSKSPCINAGIIITGFHDAVPPPLDFNGNSIKGNPDIGAFEYIYTGLEVVSSVLTSVVSSVRFAVVQ